MLIRFDPEVFSVHELLLRAAVAFSVENDFLPVGINQKTKSEFITANGWLAGFSIASALVMKLLSSDMKISLFFEWIAALATSTAVVEHAAYDYRKKGTVDPEVLSLWIIISSVIGKKNLLMPSALTWVTTFGRHFTQYQKEGIILKIDKLEDKNEKGYFRLNVSKSGNAGNLPDILAKFAEKFLSYQTGFKNSIFEEAKNVGEKHDEFIEGMDEKVNGIILNFNETN